MDVSHWRAPGRRDSIVMVQPFDRWRGRDGVRGPLGTEQGDREVQTLRRKAGVQPLPQVGDLF